MNLIGPAGQSLELRILGYQFPDLSDAEYDSNWLHIEGHVNHPRGIWSFRDPCLLTYEVSRLADWLDAVARNESVPSEIGFTEPNLSFRVIPAARGAVLRAYLDLEARPEWVQRTRR